MAISRPDEHPWTTCSLRSGVAKYAPRQHRRRAFHYCRDEAGALTRTGSTTLGWDAQGRLDDIIWATGDGISFTYDAEGRRLSKTTFNHRGQGRKTTTFHYVLGTRLVLYEEGPDGRLDYTYDADGRRLTITHNGETFWYVYNGHGDVVGLLDAAGNVAARYEYDDAGRIVRMWGRDGGEVREGQGQIRYLHGDVTAGDVSPAELMALDADGSDWDDEWDEEVTLHSGGSEIVKINPYRYAGYRYDRETQLYFLQSQYYDPWQARFISRDSYRGELDQLLTLNRYVYGLNNPVNMVDPAGYAAERVSISGVTGGVCHYEHECPGIVLTWAQWKHQNFDTRLYKYSVSKQSEATVVVTTADLWRHDWIYWFDPERGIDRTDVYHSENHGRELIKSSTVVDYATGEGLRVKFERTAGPPLSDRDMYSVGGYPRITNRFFENDLVNPNAVRTFLTERGWGIGMPDPAFVDTDAITVSRTDQALNILVTAAFKGGTKEQQDLVYRGIMEIWNQQNMSTQLGM